MRNALIAYLILWILAAGFMTTHASAFLIPSTLSGMAGEPSAQREKNLQQIRVVLESRLIAQRLTDLGFGMDEVQSRLSQLSDAQIHQMATHLEGLQTGGDGLGIVIALLVVAILVFILLQITGHKIIVTK